MSNIQPAHSPCYCISFRRAANLLTKYYDETFAAIQLTGNQFFLLNSLSQLGDCNKTDLAQYTRLDRTTIIRNLNILQKKEVIQEVAGTTKRNNVIRLTEKGEAAVTQGMVLWNQLQQETCAAIGEESLPVLWQVFEKIELLTGQ